MTTLACFCGGVIEGLVFLVWAGFAWVTGVLLRLRMRRPQLEDDELEESLELEGHVMLVAMQEAVIGAINA